MQNVSFSCAFDDNDDDVYSWKYHAFFALTEISLKEAWREKCEKLQLRAGEITYYSVHNVHVSFERAVCSRLASAIFLRVL